MSIKLQIEIEAPLTPEDNALLTGMSLMIMAIADRPLAEERFPEAFPRDPPPCGAVEPTTGFTCAGEVGHKGRHRYRDLIGDIVTAASGDRQGIN